MVQFAPDRIGQRKLFIHDSANQVFVPENFGGEQHYCEQPVQNGRFPLDEKLIVQQQGGAAEHHDDDAAGDQHAINFAVPVLDPGDLQQRGDDG